MDSEIKINIGKYIDGELQGDALVQFKKLLKTDKAIQQEVHFQQEVIQSLQAKNEFENEKEDLVSFLDGLEQNVDLSDNIENANDLESVSNNTISTQSTILKKLIPFATLAAAAAILLIIWSPWQADVSNTQFADSYFKTYVLETNMDDAAALNSYFKSGKFAYDDGVYLDAEKHFENYLEIKPTNNKVLLAKGNCEFHLGKFEEAIQTFKQVVSSKTVYSNGGNWYLALSYLKKDSVKEAKSALLQINEQSEYAQQAKQLLEHLNN